MVDNGDDKNKVIKREGLQRELKNVEDVLASTVVFSFVITLKSIET